MYCSTFTFIFRTYMGNLCSSHKHIHRNVIFTSLYDTTVVHGTPTMYGSDIVDIIIGKLLRDPLFRKYRNHIYRIIGIEIRHNTIHRFFRDDEPVWVTLNTYSNIKLPSLFVFMFMDSSYVLHEVPFRMNFSSTRPQHCKRLSATKIEVVSMIRAKSECILRI